MISGQACLCELNGVHALLCCAQTGYMCGNARNKMRAPAGSAAPPSPAARRTRASSPSQNSPRSRQVSRIWKYLGSRGNFRTGH
eukprot:2368072-Rhodomonas_salina.13